jgi:large subunit ribosomal protein L4
MESKILIEDNQTKKKAIGLIHRVYLSQLINSRTYTASTKTKSEVRGGGRKPWRQKGTGRARAGSLRSPLFVGGGVIFGPKPREVYKKVNKKERRLAILMAFALKRKQLILLDATEFNKITSIKTKQISSIIENLKINNSSKVLFVLPELNKFFWLSGRNLKNVEISLASCINLKQLLKADYIITCETAIQLVNSTFGKQYE